MLSEMKLDSLGRLVAFQVVVQDLQVVDQTMGMML
jgi:hypothetical protein